MARRLWLYAMALAIFALDRFTKHLIETRLTLWDSIEVIPRVFYLVHTQNRGAAFGMLAQASAPLRTFVLVGVAVAVLIGVTLVLWHPARWGFHGEHITLAGLALVLGGALGNVYDRVLVGSVTDFLQVFFGSYEFPSFNVADSAISVGALLLLLDMWTAHRRASSSGGDSAARPAA